MYRVQVEPWTQQLQSKMHAVAADRVIGRRVSVHGFVHLALQRYAVNATAFMPAQNPQLRKARNEYSARPPPTRPKG